VSLGGRDILSRRVQLVVLVSLILEQLAASGSNEPSFTVSPAEGIRQLTQSTSMPC
jgi:hypothetical protein